mgnify:CR=1 FL=1
MEQNPILNAKLSMDSDIPLYAQLVGIIKRNISTGALAVGDLLTARYGTAWMERPTSYRREGL